MKTIHLPRIMISGTNSGCGKTTMTNAILTGLMKKNMVVQGYKSGPDYIDPMFHSMITNRKSRNLDAYLCSEELLKYSMADSSNGADIGVIEGAMGFYDGIGKTSSASAYDVAKITQTPVILVLNAKGMARSLSAIVQGFLNLQKDSGICGVLLNGINGSMYSFYKEILDEIGIEVLGYLPSISEAEIPNRHLGLYLADEIPDFHERMDKLSDVALDTINFSRIIEIAQNTPIISYDEPIIPKQSSFQLAVAKDNAFCFYYEDNLRLLEKLGATIVYFSPIKDKKLPTDIDGIYLGGGYPELYLKELSQNKLFRESLKDVILNKDIPIYAECGGFLYLLDSIKDKYGNDYDMCGVIDGNAWQGDKLCRFGYIELTANKDNLLLKKGETMRGHEFHYSDSSNNGNDFHIKRPNGKSWTGIHATDTICVGYPHIHFYSNIKVAENFAHQCVLFRQRKQNTAIE